MQKEQSVLSALHICNVYSAQRTALAFRIIFASRDAEKWHQSYSVQARWITQHGCVSFLD